jgi:hypothetical protein
MNCPICNLIVDGVPRWSCWHWVGNYSVEYKAGSYCTGIRSTIDWEDEVIIISRKTPML